MKSSGSIEKVPSNRRSRNVNVKKPVSLDIIASAKNKIPPFNVNAKTKNTMRTVGSPVIELGIIDNIVPLVDPISNGIKAIKPIPSSKVPTNTKIKAKKNFKPNIE